jgi:hypothetical protein
LPASLTTLPYINFLSGNRFLWLRRQKRIVLVFIFLVSTSVIIALSQFSINFYPLSQPSSTNGSIQVVPSEVGADYTKLRDLLAANKFKEADEETRKLMFWITNRQEERYLDRESLSKFPCTDLHSIDALWSNNSNGKFGFDAQDQIILSEYEKRSNSRDNDSEIKRKVEETFNAFGDQIGWKGRFGFWKRKEDLTYDLRAPKGHLPAKIFLSCTKSLFSEVCYSFSISRTQVGGLLGRFKKCKS